MKVWRKQTIHYLLNGKRTSKGTKGAKPKVILSKRFYGTITLASGKRKQTPLTEDQKTSQKLLQRLQNDEDTKRTLGISPDDCEVATAPDWLIDLLPMHDDDEDISSTSILPSTLTFQEQLSLKCQDRVQYPCHRATVRFSEHMGIHGASEFLHPAERGTDYRLDLSQPTLTDIAFRGATDVTLRVVNALYKLPRLERCNSRSGR